MHHISFGGFQWLDRVLQFALTVCAALLCAAVPHRAAFLRGRQGREEKEKEAIKEDIEALLKDLQKSRDAKKTTSTVDKVLEKKKEVPRSIRESP